MIHPLCEPVIHSIYLISYNITGISGNVVLDDKGDREPDYWITDMDPVTGIFVKIAEVLNTDNGARVTTLNYTKLIVCFVLVLLLQHKELHYSVCHMPSYLPAYQAILITVSLCPHLS